MPAISKVLFILAVLVSGSGLVSPPVALTAGIVFGLSFAHPYSSGSRISARILLQAAVVALGFGMNLHDVINAGRRGFLYTAMGICFALAAGLALGKLFEVRGNSSYLITAGTAICGGSAIAAVGPILRANEEEMAVSLGTIFVLNSVALLIFPPIGGLLHLSQSQFGLWAALSIHDTSSVVGASARYGTRALVIGTTVKLARALWIVPLALATVALTRRRFRDQNGNSESSPGPRLNSISLVHPSFLPRGSREYLSPGLQRRDSSILPSRQARLNRHAFPDRNGHLTLHSSRSGLAPDATGCGSVDGGRDRHALSYPRGHHRVLGHTRRPDANEDLSIIATATSDRAQRSGLSRCLQTNPAQNRLTAGFHHASTRNNSPWEVSRESPNQLAICYVALCGDVHRPQCIFTSAAGRAACH